MAKTGVKLIIAGKSGAGKSYAVKNLEKVFAINADHTKAYTNPHAYFDVHPKGSLTKAQKEAGEYEWNGVEGFKKFLSLKQKAYSKAVGGKPKYVVIDTTTSLFNKMIDYNEATIKNVYGSLGVANNADVGKLNTILENNFVKNGIDVILLAHVVYNEVEETYSIPTKGSKSFGEQGGFLSLVDNAIYLHDDGDERQVSFSTLGLPCKTALDDHPEQMLAEEFNLEEYMEKLRIKANEESRAIKL